MAKKKLKKKVQRKPAVNPAELAAPVVDSARDVWLAGLGALSIAQQEGEKVIEQGSKFFDKLVAEGNKVEDRTRKDVDSAVSDIRGEVESRVSDVRRQADAVRKQAFDNWDKLEKIFEDRVARALASLGIPTREDVQSLADRVESLSAQVASLNGDSKAAPAKKSAPRKSTARRAAPKKAGLKKAAPKKAARKKTVSKKAASKKTTATKAA